MNRPLEGICGDVLKTPLHPKSPDELPDDVGLLKAMLENETPLYASFSRGNLIARAI